MTEFMAQLRRLVTHCQFGAFLEEALRDRLVCGLRNHSIQRRLLSECYLSLQKAVDVSTGMEAAELNSKTISTSSATEEVKPSVGCHRMILWSYNFYLSFLVAL